MFKNYQVKIVEKQII